MSRAVGILFPTHPRPEACGRSTSPKQPLRRTAARGRAVWRLASRDDGREKKLLADTGVALAFLRGCAGVHRPGRVDSYFVSVSDNTTRNSNGWPRMELCAQLGARMQGWPPWESRTTLASGLAVPCTPHPACLCTAASRLSMRGHDGGRTY